MSETIGKVLGKYKIVRELGSGGMGAVYEAKHTLLPRKVAIKILHSKFSDHPEISERFVREAQAASTIGHPNIIEVEDVGRTAEGEHYIVMEFLEGCSLSTLLKAQGALPYGEAITILMQVLEGLEAAHKTGIIHRDLKPDNLFLCLRPDHLQAKLLDFGISKIRTPALEELSLTKTGALMGTPHYMAPEQARGEKDIDEGVDIWAIGTILYQMLSGSLPFQADSYNALMFQLMTKEPRPLEEVAPDVPQALRSIVHKALAKDPEDRFPDVKSLRAALAPFATTTPSTLTDSIRHSITNSPNTAEAGTETTFVPSDHSTPARTGSPAPSSHTTGSSASQTLPTPAHTDTPAPSFNTQDALASSHSYISKAQTHIQEEIPQTPPPPAPLWKTILWFAITAALIWIPTIFLIRNPKGILTAFPLLQQLTASSGIVIALLLAGGMTFAQISLYRFWSRNQSSPWLHSSAFFAIPAIGLALILFHFLTLRGQQQTILQSIYGYTSITTAHAKQLSHLFQTSTTQFLNASFYDLLFVWLLSLLILLGYAFQRPHNHAQRLPHTRWLALPLGFVVIVLFEGFFFARLMRDTGLLHYLYYPIWLVTAIAILRVRQARTATHAPAWRRLFAGIIASVALTGTNNLIGNLEALKILRSLHTSHIEAEWFFTEHVEPLFTNGTTVHWLLLLLLYGIVVAARRDVFTLRPLEHHKLAWALGAILLTALPTFIHISTITRTSGLWLPHKVASMVPLPYKDKGSAAFYIDKAPQSLVPGRKVLYRLLSGKFWPWRKEPKLKPLLTGAKACPKLLAAALNPKSPKAARCITAKEAQTYCETRRMRLPNPSEWKAVIRALKHKPSPLQHGSLAEWRRSIVDGNTVFSIQPGTQLPKPPPQPSPTWLSKHVGFRCVFRLKPSP